MKTKTVIGILAGVALVYVAYRAMGNGLLGSSNSGVPGAQKVDNKTSKNDDRKIQLLGILSDLEAKLYGIIKSEDSKEAIQKRIDKARSELKLLV